MYEAIQRDFFTPSSCQFMYQITLLFPYEIRRNLFIQKLYCFRTKSAKIAFGMDNYGTLVFPEQVAADFVRKQQGKSLIDELLGMFRPSVHSFRAFLKVKV